MSEKVKQRFTALDVTAMVNSLRKKLLGTRVNNVYDLSQKSYVLKLTRSEQKEFLLLDSGIRFHTTTASSEKNKIPSPFAMKLRKYIRGRRLDNITQIGIERVVDFKFGSQNEEYHLILELYASGNLVLTDADYKIMALIRSHRFNDTIKTAVGEVYPFEHAANLKLDQIRTDMEHVLSIVNVEPTSQENPDEQQTDISKAQENDTSNNNNNNKNQKGGKKGGKQKQKQNNQKDKGPKRKLKDVLSKLLPCLHQGMIDQLLRDKNLAPNSKVSDEHTGVLHEIVEETIKFLKNFVTTDQEGYLSYREIPKDDVEEQKIDANGAESKQPVIEETTSNLSRASDRPQVKYYEFSPILIRSEGLLVRKMENFDKCVDEFYQNINVPKVQPKQEKKRIAYKKYENIKQDQENRLNKLRKEQQECVVKALLIESNLEKVDAIVQIVGAMVQGGISWDKIWKMISESKEQGNPFAAMITKISLDKNLVYVNLEFVGPARDDWSGAGEPPTHKEVDIDVRLKAYNNAQKFYQERKRMEAKEKKTMEASNQALKMAEKAAMREMNQEKQKSHLLIARKNYWFEKFFWFITSENYLVICGRDMQQNEMIVKRYLKKGDIYMHADIHGAASVVIKNIDSKPVPQRTLEEAAVFTICRSKAWESKIVTSAWWVYDSQVSKTAPSGEYLPTGSFMIRGKKNFMNPSRLEMGFGLMYKVDDLSLPNHLNDRRIREEDQLQLQASEAQESTEATTVDPADSAFFITNQNQKREIGQFQNQKNQQGGNNNNNNNNNNKGQKGGQQNKNQKQSSKNNVADSDSDEEDPFRALKAKKAQNNNNNGNNNKGGNNQNNGKNQQNDPFNQLGKKASRGKQQKLKRMKEKYADQDEEERELRLKAIGGQKIKELRDEDSDDDQGKGKGKKNKKDKGKQKGGKQNQSNYNFQPKNKEKGGSQQNLDQQKKAFEKQEKVDIEEQIEIPKDLDAQQEAQNKEIEVPKEDAPMNDVEFQKQNSQKLDNDIQQEDQEEQKQNSQENNEQNSDKEEAKLGEIKSTKENNDELDPELYDKDLLDSDEEREIRGKMNKPDKSDNQSMAPSNFEEDNILSEGDELRKLVSNPLVEDQLLFCVPVCAPYITMQNYKYKSKLVPGGMKRGKAVKMVMQLFNAQKEMPELEKKLMKSTNDTELIAAMIGNVKIGAAGMLKVKQKEQKAKQERKKEHKKK